jgi:hypothetical protein
MSGVSGSIFTIQKGLAFQFTSSPSFIPTFKEDIFDIT